MTGGAGGGAGREVGGSGVEGGSCAWKALVSLPVLQVRENAFSASFKYDL